MIFSMKAIIEKVQVSSKEYWGSFVSNVQYYEEWNQWITKTCTRECCCDDKGENCSEESYDCSYCETHPAQWILTTTTGESISIDQNEYIKIRHTLGGEKFVELNRDFYTKDGNEYYCSWENHDSTKAIPVSTLHYYENRVKAADQSVFHYEKVSSDDVKKYSLKEYPMIYNYYKMTSVIGDSSSDASTADKKICYINGFLGNKKQVKVFVLVFKNQPIEAALYQEWYWSGGNKNEFIVCVGIDNDRNVKWCKPISWTRSEELKDQVKDFVQSQKKLNLTALAVYLEPQIDKQFVRRGFREFDYLTVEPPGWAVFLTYLLTIISNLLLSRWIIRNEYEDDKD